MGDEGDDAKAVTPPAVTASAGVPARRTPERSRPGAPPAPPREALPAPAGKPPAPRERRPRLGKRPAPVRPALSMTSQEAPIAEETRERDLLWLAIAAGLRLTALAFVVASIAFWAELVGYRASPLSLTWHDLEGPWLQTFFCALTFPVAAIGLWLLANWGVVVWASVSALALALFVLTPWSPDLALLAIVLNTAMMTALAALGVVRLRRTAQGEEEA